MAKQALGDFARRCQDELAHRWGAVQSKTTSIPEDVRAAVARSINSRTKSYRYVLPTQVLAKLVDPSLYVAPFDTFLNSENLLQAI
jgi:hypothetical protein